MVSDEGQRLKPTSAVGIIAIASLCAAENRRQRESDDNLVTDFWMGTASQTFRPSFVVRGVWDYVEPFALVYV